MDEKEFRKNIYEYCNNNVNGKDGVLFTVFTNLGIQLIPEISPKDLANLTSRIINDLVREGTLEEIPKPLNFDVPYGMYKILPYNKLIKE